MKRTLILFCVIASLLPQLPVYTVRAQGAGSIPDPIRFYNKYEVVWEVVRRSLMTDFQMDIETEDRSSGKMRTRPLEFTSGSLAFTDLVKFGNPPKLTDANWIKARYFVEASMERFSSKEVLFTVNVTVEGFKRDFQGAETWIPCPSTGTLERRIYSKIGTKLIGNDFAVPADKKGFWDNAPQGVPGTRTGPTPLPVPDRKPPPQ